MEDRIPAQPEETHFTGSSRAPRDREELLIQTYVDVLPTAVFERVFGRKETFVRNRRKWLGLKVDASVKSRFIKLKSLPPLELLTDDERQIVRQVWHQLRQADESDPVKRRRIRILDEFSGELPGQVLAALLEVTVSAVQEHQRVLGLQLTPREGRKLRSTFAALEAPPRIEGLEANEQRIVNRVWNELHESTKSKKRRREDELLQWFSEIIPCAAYAELFGLSQTTIVYRRESLGIKLKKNSNAIRNQFPRHPALPLSETQLALLTPRERRSITKVWEKYRAAYLAEREKAREIQEKALLDRLLSAKVEFLTTHSVDELFACSSESCGHRWPRTHGFFKSNWRSPDGLGNRCALCHLRRRFAPNRRKGRSPIRIEGEVRDRAREIVKAIGADVPNRLIADLIGITPELVKFLRYETGVTMNQVTSHDLLLWWAVVDEMPSYSVLLAHEKGRLIDLWQKLKTDFWAKIENDDDFRQVMEAEREAMLSRPDPPNRNVCVGHYCRGLELWPKDDFFFSRSHGGSDGKGCCRSCYYWSIRISNVKKRFARIDAVHGARIRGR